MKIIHKPTQKVLGENIVHANSFYTRLKGLMFVDEMKGMDGLLLEPGTSIHNCFVRFPIDAIFISKDNVVVGFIRSLKPWRFSRIYFSARKVLELPAGTLPESLSVGDELEVKIV